MPKRKNRLGKYGTEGTPLSFSQIYEIVADLGLILGEDGHFFMMFRAYNGIMHEEQYVIVDQSFGKNVVVESFKAPKDSIYAVDFLERDIDEIAIRHLMNSTISVDDRIASFNQYMETIAKKAEPTRVLKTHS